MATSRIQILIEADDKASVKLRALAAGLDQVSEKTKKSSLTFKDALKGITAGLAAAGIAAATFKKAFDFAEAGAQLQRLEAAGDHLATSFGQNMDSLVQSIQNATNGAIPEFEAMGLANRALLLGVARTPEQFTKLATAAAALGQAMGRTSSEAMNDIVTGIGRMSPLILDNLGIMTRGGKVYEEYAESVGRSAESLTDTEKKQILLNSALESAQPLLSAEGKLVADNATSWETLSASLKDTTDSALIWLSDGLTPILSGFQLLDRAFDENADRILANATTYEDYMQLWDQVPLARWDDILTAAEFHAAKLAPALGNVGSEAHGVVRDFSVMAEEVGRVIGEMPEIPSIWDKAFPSPAELARKLQEQIDFIQAGGPSLVAAMENVQSALAEGMITPEQAEEMLDPLSAAAQGLMIELGQTDIWAAAKARSAEMGITFDEARKDILIGVDAIGTIPQSIDIKINWIMENPVPTRQHGGPVWPGQPFLVGEQGPELFVPPQAGNIIDNSRTTNDHRSFVFNSNSSGGEDLIEKMQQRVRRL